MRVINVGIKVPLKIISGGQTGVDQGALDFALDRGLECGGWCPKDRRCETGRIPDKYPLREVEVEDYNERTRRNVQDAEATLVITLGSRMEPGTRLTLEWAGFCGRPCFHLNLKAMDVPDDELLSDARAWLASAGIKVLNVAGNRESTVPGIGRLTVQILCRLFRVEEDPGCGGSLFPADVGDE